MIIRTDPYVNRTELIDALYNVSDKYSRRPYTNPDEMNRYKVVSELATALAQELSITSSDKCLHTIEMFWEGDDSNGI